MIKYTSAGESHGCEIIAILEGIPSGLRIDSQSLADAQKIRQSAYGRSSRMKSEALEPELISGVLNGITTGAPIAIKIKNSKRDNKGEFYVPRPGHADLAGLLKYAHDGGRNTLERASARETALRVIAGDICVQFLKSFNIELISYVISIGSVESEKAYYKGNVELEAVKKDPLYMPDSTASKRALELIDQASKEGYSLGGKIEAVVKNLPIGLGSFIQWDRRVDALLSKAIMSIPSVKGIHIGDAESLSNYNGNEVYDPIIYDNGYKRIKNHAGGVEGGMTNGEDLVIQVLAKPIPTQKIGLKSVDIRTKKEAEAFSERADTTAIPAVSIIVKSMIAIVLAGELLRKFGGDSITETYTNYKNYTESIQKR